MKKIITTLLLSGMIVTVKAQNIVTTDIDNFWTAYDSLQKVKTDRLPVLEQLLVQKRSGGLKAFMEIKQFDGADYLKVIEKYPQFWRSLRANTIIDLRKRTRINKALQQFNVLYPNQSKGTIYYTIGALKSGGTTNGEDLLLGIEKIVGTPQTITTEFAHESLRDMFRFPNPMALEQVTLHEYVHTFQKGGEVNVLSKAIKEGSCDFIAALALKQKINTHYLDYGRKNYELVKSAFKQEMLTSNFENWFYNPEAEHPDLGYFAGYEITRKYYEKAKDKQAAIRSIIELDFGNEAEVVQFLEKSGYYEGSIEVEQLKAAYSLQQPKVVKIIEFENGQQNLPTSLNRIQIVFSKPMVDNISINFSKNGKAHFPLKRVVGLDTTRTILSLETVELAPDTWYDFYITDRSTRSEDHFPFVEPEYKISFKTR